MNVCKRCVLPGTFPGIKFDAQGICNICRQRENREKQEQGKNFQDEQELAEVLEKCKNPNGKYDVLVPLSGGVDSCYTLITIVETFHLRALAFHNDHGYEEDIATENVRNICKALNVDLVILQQDLKFMKKLWKYLNEANVKGLNTCYVCGNILFLNALEAADRFGTPIVINGYSKGQAAMTYDKEEGSNILEKLITTFEKTGDSEFFKEFLDKYKILAKKIDYQTREDFEQLGEPGKILFVPFYVFEFYKTDKKALREHVEKRFAWKPLTNSYPNRTTNCEMVWLNCYMDREKMGYSLYEIEYSELVRKGEMTREQALKDLEFNPPKGLVERLAGEVEVDMHKFRKEDNRAGSQPQTSKNKIEVQFDF